MPLEIKFDDNYFIFHDFKLRHFEFALLEFGTKKEYRKPSNYKFHENPVIFSIHMSFYVRYIEFAILNFTFLI